MWYWIIALVAVAAIGTAAFFWWRSRHLAKEASDLAGLVALGQDANYRMACQLYGKDQVEASIRRANARGVS